jgi:hypothetical protein
MSRYPRKINRAAAERLLRGEPADPRHPDDLLAVLFAQAAAPAKAAERAGEEAAVAAFRDARSADAFRDARSAMAGPGAGSAGAPHVSRRGDDARAAARYRPWLSRATRRWVRHPVQLAAVALTATAAGGIALAAGTVTRSPDPAHTPPGSSVTASQPAGTASVGRRPGGAPGGTADGSPVGLCRAYKAGAGDAAGRALDSPAFTSLVKAAGGKDKVPGYCAAVLAPDSGAGKDPARPSARPRRSDEPRGKASPPVTRPKIGEAPATRPARPAATPPAGPPATSARP